MYRCVLLVHVHTPYDMMPPPTICEVTGGGLSVASTSYDINCGVCVCMLVFEDTDAPHYTPRKYVLSKGMRITEKMVKYEIDT